jgi:bla regulator protein BlaR1
MSTLLSIAITNAIVVVPLAILAWFVGRTARRPALTHALWILVMLKLVTPPMFHWSLPISLPDEFHSTVGESKVFVCEPLESAEITRAENGTPVTATLCVDGSTSDSVVSVDSSSNDQMSDRKPLSRPKAVPGFLSAVWKQNATALVAVTVTLQRIETGWITALISIWAGGILVVLGTQAWMVIRFGSRVAAVGSPDDELQRQTEQLAREMGLRRCPEVQVVAATVSPMLWSYGAKTRLLFPQDLLSRLDHESRKTLLIHELAHYGRGDHWVRCLEFLATGIFWWHPVVWWARHQIEQSEEECCDAWVVDQIRHNPRRYAEALLDTIDFLCGDPFSVPPMASGLGSASFLRRRLINIMQASSPKAMSNRVRAVVALLMIGLLPTQPLVFASLNRQVSSLNPLNGELTVLFDRGSSSIDSDETEPDLVNNDLESQFATQTPSPSNTGSPRVPASRKSRSQRGEKAWSNAISSDGRFVVQATTGRRVLLNDLHKNQETDLSSHAITAVSFTPDGRQFVAVTSDGLVDLWDAESSQRLRTLHTHESGLRSVHVSPDGDAVVAGGLDGSMLVLDLKTGNSLTEWVRQALPINCVRFSPDASRLAVALGEWNSNDQGKVLLINLRTGMTETLKCGAAPGAITFVSNDELIVGQWNGYSTLWNLPEHKIVGAATAEKGIIAAVAFSPDNPQLREIAFESPTAGDEPVSPRPFEQF